MEKEYNTDLPRQNKVEEPALIYKRSNSSSYSISLTERKAQLVESILNNVEDEETLKELELFYAGLINKNLLPCNYSVEELKERTKISIQQAKEGKVTTLEQMKKRFL